MLTSYDGGAPPFNSAVDICRHHVRCREKQCTAFQFSCRHMSDVVKRCAPPFNSAVDICRHMSDVVESRPNRCIMSTSNICLNMSTYVDIGFHYTSRKVDARLRASTRMCLRASTRVYARPRASTRVRLRASTRAYAHLRVSCLHT